MAIKGQNLRIFAGIVDNVDNLVCIGSATSCTLHISTQTEDSSTKDDEDDWASSEVTGKSWDMQVEALVTMNDEGTADGKGGAVSTPSIMSIMIDASQIYVMFDMATGASNRTSGGSNLRCGGWGYITDLNISAANRQNATMSVQVQGVGPLEMGL